VKLYQERVVNEKRELDSKRTKLGSFMCGDIFSKLDEDEKARLTRQFEVMGEYSEILGERISAFKD